jgi:ribonuclease HI
LWIDAFSSIIYGDVLPKLFFDGECLPKNPGGIMTYGYLIYLEDGRVLSGYGVVDDVKRTNNVAEYRSLIKGVERALQEGIRSLEIYGDSMLVIKQLSGEWGIYEPHLSQLVSEARELLSRFKRYRLNWIPSISNPAEELSIRAYYEEEIRRLLQRAPNLNIKEVNKLSYIVGSRLVSIDPRSGRITCTCSDYILKSHYNVMKVKDLQPICVHVAHLIQMLGIDIGDITRKNITNIVRRGVNA